MVKWRKKEKKEKKRKGEERSTRSVLGRWVRRGRGRGKMWVPDTKSGEVKSEERGATTDIAKEEKKEKKKKKRKYLNILTSVNTT